ncbi:TPA: hypothetical protein ACX3EF_004546 [Vibrio parahaemolyticus]|uniref:hypothetical protein n=1 Tax=Vibrio parahaemolyticus TaxID=670 RepID=UPI002879C564|nr:hypothetical protein [Vibrio parahaemolyticus]MDS1925679.1 hypothetical protein [Vibrio parahaemolyticus]
MGWLIVYLITAFDPSGFMFALMWAVPIFIFGLGFFFAESRIWLSAAMTAIAHPVLMFMLSDPELAEFSTSLSALFYVARFAEVIAALSLTVFTLLGVFAGRSVIGVSLSEALTMKLKSNTGI